MYWGKKAKPVNREDIQGIVASGYDHLDHARFVFLKIVNREAAKHWLSNILEQITTAEYPGDHKSDSCLNLAVSWPGLRELGVSELVHDFPHEFVEGMNRKNANLILGDLGESSDEHWDYGGDAAKPLHVLLLLYGKTVSDMQLLQHQIYRPSAFVDGLRIVALQDDFRKPRDYTEPFGFRDGISQPPVEGLVGRQDSQSEHPISTGEFVLGYKNELSQFTRIPSVSNWDDPRGYLCDHPESPGRCRAFGLNGTYLVFRKLVQNVSAFWAYIDEMSRDPNPQDIPTTIGSRRAA